MTQAQSFSEPAQTERRRELAAVVRRGLTASPKSLPSYLFYDDAGSEIFVEIMALPEYYLTRAEHEILAHAGPELAAALTDGAPHVDLIELGAGDGQKTLTMCRHLVACNVPCTYLPIDISQLALDVLVARFAEALPRFDVRPLCASYADHWPAVTPGHRQVVMFLGSNLGNFAQAEATAMLRRVRGKLAPGDQIVLGLDLQKHPQVIRDAYDDAAGVTARFNLNVLHRLNEELGAGFDLAQFEHYASYNPLDGIVRSFLVSKQVQTVSGGAADGPFTFAAGEAIHTENSQKYTPAMIDALALAAQCQVSHRFYDAERRYTVVVLQAIA